MSTVEMHQITMNADIKGRRSEMMKHAVAYEAKETIPGVDDALDNGCMIQK